MSDRNALSIDGDSLVVVPRGLDRVWGFRKRIVVPLTSVSNVTIETDPHRVRRGLRYPGLDAYWKRSGTFHPVGGERHYWNSSGSGEVLSLRLTGHPDFDQLYLSVADPEGTQRMILQATSSDHALSGESAR